MATRSCVWFVSATEKKISETVFVDVTGSHAGPMSIAVYAGIAGHNSDHAVNGAGIVGSGSGAGTGATAL